MSSFFLMKTLSNLLIILAIVSFTLPLQISSQTSTPTSRTVTQETPPPPPVLASSDRWHSLISPYGGAIKGELLIVGNIEINHKFQDLDKTFSLTYTIITSDGNNNWSYKVAANAGHNWYGPLDVSPMVAYDVSQKVPQDGDLMFAGCLRSDGTPTGVFKDNKVSGVVVELGKTTVCTFDNNIGLTLANTLPEEVLQVAKTKEASNIIKSASIVGLLSGFSSVLSAIISYSSISDLILKLLRFFYAILIFFGIRKKSFPWGVAYDSATKQPLDPAYITLKDQQGREVAHAITDLDGRYGFSVPPGKYTIEAKKTNYEFPSKLVANRMEDEIYKDLYFGGSLEAAKGSITKNIPLDPLKFDWNEFAKRSKGFMKFYSRWSLASKKIFDFLFVVGFLFSVGAYFVNPEPYNTVILMMYLVLLLLRVLGLKSRTLGYIIDKGTRAPLSFALMKIVTPENVQVSSKVADQYGRYYCLVPRGKYHVIIDKRNEDGTYSSVYLSPIIDASRNGIIKKKFEV